MATTHPSWTVVIVVDSKEDEPFLGKRIQKIGNTGEWIYMFAPIPMTGEYLVMDFSSGFDLTPAELRRWYQDNYSEDALAKAYILAHKGEVYSCDYVEETK